MVGKIGYGTVSEVLAHNKPLVFIRRDYFNEEPFLRKLLELNGAAVEMRRKNFLGGNWGPFLEHAITLEPHYRYSANMLTRSDIVAGVSDFSTLMMRH